MPRVSVFTGGMVQPQGTTGARFQPADFGESGLGNGLRTAGASLSRVADVEAEIANKRSEARVKRADVEAEIELASLRAKELAAEKFDAMGAVGRYTSEAKKVRDRIVRDLGAGRRESAAFSMVFAQRLSRDLATLQLHESKQTVGAEREASATRITTYVDRAVELRDDPDAAAESLQTALNEATKLYASDGPDVAQQKRAAIRSAFRVQVADALQNTDPLKAKQYVDEHAAEILETDETKIRRQLQPHVEEAEIDDGMDAVEALLAGAVPDTDKPEQVRNTTVAVNADPLRGKGRVTTTPEQHLKRGRLALDLGAPVGTPIYPPMSGRVVGKGYDPDGNGHFVRVKHPNGFTTTYLHMRGPSPLDEGEEVDANTVLGGVGSTGRSTGPHLDYSVKDNAGKPINPQSVRWQEGDLPQYKAERNDKQALYDAARRVATERNYSRRQYDQLLQRVDAQVQREDGLQQRAESDALEAALETVASLEQAGGKLTRRDQIPNWNALPAQARLQLLGQIEQNTRPKEIPANGDITLAFELMAVNEPGKFAAADLRLYRHQMTPGEFGSLAKTQAQIRNKGPSAPVVTDHGRIWGMIGRYGPEVGLEPTSKDKGDRARSHRVFQLVKDDLDRLTAGKRQPTDDEVKGAFDRATLEVVVRGGGMLGLTDKRVRRFELSGQQGSVDVPGNVQERIASSWRRQHGRSPSAQEIARTYVDHKGKPGFW